MRTRLADGILCVLIIQAIAWNGCTGMTGGLPANNENRSDMTGNDNIQNNVNDNTVPDNLNGNTSGGSGGSSVGEWVEEAKLGPVDRLMGDVFGTDVAVSNGVIVVTRPGYFLNSGNAYIYGQSSGRWMEQAILLPGDNETAEDFGVSVDIDGDTIVVGKTGDTVGFSAFDAGAVYVFENRSGWVQIDKLVAADAQAQDNLGSDVAIDGNTIVAGAFGRDSLRGIVLVFAKTQTGQWTPETSLEPSDVPPLSSNWFGDAVAVDGDTVVVGAPVQDRGTGAVYVYERNEGRWDSEIKLLSPTPNETDQFGYAVAISGDTLVVGEPLENSNSGAVHVFIRQGSDWVLQQTLLDPDNPDNLHQFGWSVDIQDDRLVVGTPVSSVIFVFERQAEVWSLSGRLMPGASCEGCDLFGTSVSLDGEIIVGGAPFNEDAGFATGASYVFELDQ